MITSYLTGCYQCDVSIRNVLIPNGAECICSKCLRVYSGTEYQTKFEVCGQENRRLNIADLIHALNFYANSCDAQTQDDCYINFQNDNFGRIARKALKINKEPWC